jgi:hypothetical protein
VKIKNGFWIALLVALFGSIPIAAWCQSEADDTTAVDPSPEGDVGGRLESITEQLQTLQADTDKLKKFKFSGYLQARWEHAEDQSDTVRVVGNPGTVTPANRERFFIRRARLKLTYDSSPLSQAVVYFDGGADRTIRLLDAYVTLFDPWTAEHRHALTIGQMNVPFGYEIERSSSVRELPERSRAENVLFSGERDRGIKLVSQWAQRLETVVGILNGGGINHPLFGTTDPTRKKDLVARARLSLGVFDAAASYYTGREVTPLVGPDIESEKTRLGFDAQVFYELPSMGGGSLTGEYYQGDNLNADSLRILVPAPPTGGPSAVLRPGADPSHLATEFIGGYVMWVQNFGDQLQLAARYEVFDPDTNLDHDRFERVGIGVHWFYDGFTRLSAAYDIPKTERLVGGQYKDPKDNLWTAQFQHRF